MHALLAFLDMVKLLGLPLHFLEFSQVCYLFSTPFFSYLILSLSCYFCFAGKKRNRECSSFTNVVWRAFLKTRKLNGPEKPFVKLRLAYSVKLVFLYVVKGIKIKITAKFCDTEHFRFEDTKRNMSPEKFRVFRETGT